MNVTTRAEAARAFCAHFMPDLLGTEDLGRFESIVASDGKSLLAGAMSACLADFDASLRASHVAAMGCEAGPPSCCAVASRRRRAGSASSGFSIDVEDPKLNVGKLYSALFAGIDRPTMISLEPTAELEQNRKAFSFFESLKKVVDGACEKTNPSLADIGKKAEGLNADDEAERS